MRYPNTQNHKTDGPITLETELCKKLLTKLRKKEIITIRERDILLMYYGFELPPKTFEEIGYIFNITRERAKQIRDKALQKLRHPKVIKYFK